MDKVYAPKTLTIAWAKVRANKGAAGVDGQSIGRFAAKAEMYLSELSAALREGTYRPQAVRRVDIPKGPSLSRLRAGGKTRPLGIPTVKDRIVQQAVRLVIEPIFEHGFSEGSYGFRPIFFLRLRAEDAGAMMRCAEGARFQHDARGRSADQGRIHPCGGRRLGWIFRLDSA